MRAMANDMAQLKVALLNQQLQQQGTGAPTNVARKLPLESVEDVRGLEEELSEASEKAGLVSIL